MRATSLNFTCEPSGFTRSRIWPNCSADCRRVWAMSVAFKPWPGNAGAPPSWPADTCALFLHFLREERQRELQLVLHLHLRDVRVRAGIECERDGRIARRVARRGQITEVVNAYHLLLDDLRDGVFQRFPRRAGIGDIDLDGRR